MKPLNQAERNNAFLRFLLFFVLTIALILIVVFFSVRGSISENNHLRQKVDALSNEKKFADTFNVVLQEAMIEIGKFKNIKGNADANAILFNVDNKIVEMQDLRKKKQDSENSIYARIVENVTELSAAQAQLSKNKLVQ